MSKIDIILKIMFLTWEKERMVISTSQAKQAEILDEYGDTVLVDFKDFGVALYKDKEDIRIISE